MMGEGEIEPLSRYEELKKEALAEEVTFQSFPITLIFNQALGNKLSPTDSIFTGG